MASPAGIALLAGPQDGSQLIAQLNALIEQINAFNTGVGGSVMTTPVSAQSTASNISPTAGQVTVNSTTRTTGTTGRYTLTAPPYAGITLKISSLSTVKATISGNYERSKSKISMSSTAALGSANLPSVILTSLSTSAWGITAIKGKVTSS